MNWRDRDCLRDPDGIPASVCQSVPPYYMLVGRTSISTPPYCVLPELSREQLSDIRRYCRAGMELIHPMTAQMQSFSLGGWRDASPELNRGTVRMLETTKEEKS